jgi:Na+/H+ antiporter NhaD/arsenite permease-like protein
MNVAALSVAALLLAIVVSCVTPLNVGVLAVVLAWLVGVYAGGMSLATVMGGFPSQLFLTLVGVTLLFTLAHGNGTLDRVAHRAVQSCRGNRGLVPVMFFALAAALASIGPGNIATAAIMAPMAMATAGRVGVPAFLMAIMVGNGANAGALSPFAPTGIIVNGLMDRIGLGGYEARTYAYNALAHMLVAFGGYLLLGGWKLFRSTGEASGLDATGSAADSHFDRRHWLTLTMIAALIIGVIFFDVNVGMGAFVGAVVLVLFRCADDREAIRKMPWGVILMVSGVTVLISVLEKSQGIDLMVSQIARFATAETAAPGIALLTGVVSAYSSTSGVVLPAFLPMVPGLTEQLGGVEGFSIASSMNIGGHLVDVSPLSTIGALCIAAAPLGEDTRKLFNQLLVWGLSMCVVGAIICYVLFSPRSA